MKQMDTFFGIRFGSFILIWVVLLVTIFKTVEPKTILSSLILYSIPIALDYFGHAPLEERNVKRRNLSLWTAIGLTILCLAFLLIDVNIQWFIDNLYVKSFLCIISSFFVFFAGLDWVGYSTESEFAYRKKIREAQKLHQETYRFEERVKEKRKNAQEV
ncbi:hypothetical protein PU629_07310 [Pullulanibacillus sp. KACC 23026]|uniref:hypothetical protein n=1 Tax=Pullulanibacillus sp. KACC 23026 TaxID=3028315 RepID=UPI0023B0A005|nr:hypothetical protein [Pullulanibacillus sp. KACC 23026]WEG14165.1 hypothetical protein PU629_07310 [Pullulanibacillus sp. KACC 23026]